MKKDDWNEFKDEFFNSFLPDRTLMSLRLFGEKVRFLLQFFCTPRLPLFPSIFLKKNKFTQVSEILENV